MTIDFQEVVRAIVEVNRELTVQTVRAVNVRLTLRNFMIGYYIEAFQLQGADRAAYGDQLFAKLATELTEARLSNCDKRQLYYYLRLFQTYPQIMGTLSIQLQALLLPEHSRTDMRTTSILEIPAEQLISGLSYSHLELLVALNDEPRRRFYESAALDGKWSVRELNRQISSLYYERSSLSTDKETLAKAASIPSAKSAAALTVRDPYVFEFLGIKSQEIMNESRIEEAILDNLQKFLLELGHGFCFESRQQRLLIGGEHFFVDLVFYHRILKCHVLVELKVGGFSHEHLGQINTYVTWYKKNMMTEGDNAPVGILLCTQKNQMLVEYALAGMDNQLFVSKYQMELPKVTEIEGFLTDKL